MFNNKWNKNHIASWKIPLEINGDGFSNFQSSFLSEVKSFFESNEIKYSEEITTHIDNIKDNKTVKLITLSLTDFSNSELWIYHDMADYNINEKHRIFEEWGYLSPNEMQEKFIESLHNDLKIK